MDTDERSEPSPQSPPTAEASPQPGPAAGSSPHATPRNRPRSILRRLAGHWKGIFLTWLLVFPPVAYLIHRFVEPTYEAFSVLQIEPTKERLFSIDVQDFTDRKYIEPYLQTQVLLMTSDKVLDQAISADPRIANLPMINSSMDPKAELRKQMVVEIVDNRTYLIRVALASANPEEAAAIVNAVVDAYLEQHNEYHRSANKALHKSLSEELDKLAKDISAKKTELKELVEKGHVEISRVTVEPVASKKDDSRIPLSLDVVTEEQYARVADRLIQADLELIDAQAKLETAKRTRKPGEAKPGDQPAIAGSSPRRPRRSSVSWRLPSKR